jgi:hypothetical protein
MSTSSRTAVTASAKKVIDGNSMTMIYIVGKMGGYMPHVQVPKKSSSSSGLNWRPVVEEYKIKAGVEPESPSGGDAVGIEDTADPDPTSANAACDAQEKRMGAPVNLGKLREPQSRSRVDEIAALMLALTYGEMIELADAIWKAQPDGSAITAENLPAVLHHWSKARAGLQNDAHE